MLSLAFATGLAAEDFSEYQIKAAFLLKFAQFTTWPNSSDHDFNVCVYGTDPFQGGLAVIQDKTVGHRKVAIRHPSALPEVMACQLLYVNPAKPEQRAFLLSQLRSVPVLTVSDDPAAWDDDVMIVVSNEPGRVVFRVNLTAARHAGLELSSHMLGLAREVR
jgi:hypothetical protein